MTSSASWQRHKNRGNHFELYILGAICRFGKCSGAIVYDEVNGATRDPTNNERTQVDKQIMRAPKQSEGGEEVLHKVGKF